MCDARERIETVLARALRVARKSRAHIFEPQVDRELAALARLRAAWADVQNQTG